MPSRARLHLVDLDGLVEEPWRPYFRNGVLFTGNNDMGYIGHVYHDASNGTTPWSYTLDRSDFVISAGENDLTEAFRQRIRFIYTTTPVAGGTGAESYNGLEYMQLFPFNKDQGFVGVGDFTAVGQSPTERLHMRNGRLRIEQLPSDPVANTLTKVMVVDDTPGANFGVVKWRDASTLGGTACDWTVSAGPNHVWTATGALNPNCPDATENVGIGLTVPVAKLDVARTVNSGGATSLGFNVLMTTNSTNNVGGVFTAEVGGGGGGQNVGARGIVRNGPRN
ncbi:MAG: hypothetical protein IPJ76_13615 [Flavobacteriales bacterium]|nr:MAG: hypothetical protein IPJ76_13615 [Flavobacteriales bacterium]